MKSALGISSRSLVHRWTVAGGADQIPGYATHFEGVSRASKYLKYGGWIGTAIGGGASYMKVQDVCTAGDAQACKRVKFKEGGGFAGGLAGGVAVGSVLTASTTGAICLGLSISTAGVGGLACGLVVVAAGSLGAGLLGGEAGEEVGDIIYEYMQ